MPPRGPGAASEARAKGGGGEADGELEVGEADEETRVRRPSGEEKTRTWLGVREEVSRTISRIIGGIEERVGAGKGEDEAGEGLGETSDETERQVRSSVLKRPVSGSSRLNWKEKSREGTAVSDPSLRLVPRLRHSSLPPFHGLTHLFVLPALPCWLGLRNVFCDWPDCLPLVAVVFTFCWTITSSMFVIRLCEITATVLPKKCCG